MSLICVSLMEKTISEITASADKCRSLGADIIEIRLDHFKEEPSFSTLEKLSKLNEITGLPLILTIRPTWEGGNFEEDEGQRLEILKGAIKTGFNYIDLEMKMDGKKRDTLIASAKKSGVKTIVSYHNLKGTPSWKEIFNQIKECADTGADIAKVVYYNKSLGDALNVLKAGSAAKNIDHNFTAMGMGPYGHITRILAPAIGCEIVYASLEEGKETSEGQIDVMTLKETWDILGIK
jgi:3-dehydroquinate dehydratase/shikimate dehydrogenase